MARRANGSGSIWRRGSDGRWTGRYISIEGKRKHIYAHSRSDAEKRLREAIVAEEQRYEADDTLLRLPAKRTQRGEAISKRTRFSILARDNFRCRYCGRGADQVELHVDHVVARVNGGSNDPGNLVSACRDCNLGKASLTAF